MVAELAASSRLTGVPGRASSRWTFRAGAIQPDERYVRPRGDRSSATNAARPADIDACSRSLLSRNRRPGDDRLGDIPSAVGPDRRLGGRSESRQIRECRFPRTSGTGEPQERTSPLALSARCGRGTSRIVDARLCLSPRTGLPVVMEQERTGKLGGRRAKLSVDASARRDALELWPCQSCGLLAAFVALALALRRGPRAAPAPRRGSCSPAPAGRRWRVLALGAGTSAARPSVVASSGFPIRETGHLGCRTPEGPDGLRSSAASLGGRAMVV